MAEANAALLMQLPFRVALAGSNIRHFRWWFHTQMSVRQQITDYLSVDALRLMCRRPTRFNMFGNCRSALILWTATATLLLALFTEERAACSTAQAQTRICSSVQTGAAPASFGSQHNMRASPPCICELRRARVCVLLHATGRTISSILTPL